MGINQGLVSECRSKPTLWRIIRRRYIGKVVAILLAQVAGDLRVEVNAIHHDDDCGIVELRMQPRLLRGEDHEQRFAAALKMPDETFLILRNWFQFAF